MIAALQSRRAEIAELCRRFHVKQLDVFGSAARVSDFTEESDIDFLVDYADDHRGPRFQDYLDLRDALAALLDRKVDLVMAGAVKNPYLRESIERSRQTVHGA